MITVPRTTSRGCGFSSTKMSQKMFLVRPTGIDTLSALFYVIFIILLCFFLFQVHQKIIAGYI